MKNKLRKSHQQGFTLLEVMVVVVIIAVMAAAIGPSIIDNIKKAKESTAKADIKSIKSSLQLYKAENSNYPSTDQGLEALVEQPSGEPAVKNWRRYLEQKPVDPWGNDYNYLSPGANGDFDIFSFGDDGVKSEDDINSWTES